ncbi:MAG: hypothetical protein QM535_03765 [Limnohabitans sp.]|nr:hypothetical protein [Limnohabitans sp.]
MLILFKILGIIILLIAILFIYGFVVEKISKKKHNDFKKTLEGKSLYISTNKRDFQKLNHKVIHTLNADIICVELAGGKVKSIYDTDKIHRFINYEQLKNSLLPLK